MVDTIKQKSGFTDRLATKLALFHPKNVLLEQMQPVLQASKSALVANGLIAILLAIVVQSSGQGSTSILWACWCLSVVLCSFVLLNVVNRNFNTNDGLLTGTWLLTVGSGLRGLVWGVGFVILMPSANSYEQIMLGWMVSGMMCGGSFSAWSMPSAALAFTFLAGVGGFLGMYAVPGVGQTWMPYAVPLLFFLLMRTMLASTEVFRKSVFSERQIADKNAVISLLLRDFEENASDWLWETDASGYLTRGSERFARLMELDKQRFQGRTLVALTELHGTSDPNNEIFRTKFKAREPFSSHVVALGDVGMERYLKLSAKPFFNRDGVFTGWHGVAADITDERIADMKVRKLALFDALTELPNRAFYYDRLEATLQSSGETNSWVMYLDLDGFKAVNDTFGHAAGDTLLRNISRRLSSCLPAKGMLARLGGDEFAVVCSGPKERIESYARLIIESLVQPCSVGNAEIVVGVSIGIAQVLPDVDSIDELMRRADVALYAAKAQGRGIARIYDEALDGIQLRRKDIEIGLRDALTKGFVTLHYQPIVDVQSGEVQAYEALLRLETPELGKVPPDEFIPIAEEAGLIGQIGDWVIKQACADASEWPNSLGVSVNISPLQLSNMRILNVVTQALAQSRLAPGRLELELTESALIENVEHTTHVLSDLKSLGVRLALDDFGTGYSSLSHLHQFNFDKIKIDRSFVQSFGERKESAAVVSAVVHLARDLGISITAEGIETAAHLRAMREAGCHFAQGYFLGRPAPILVRGEEKQPLRDSDVA